MKVGRLLSSVLCFLLIINFFRTINGAGFLGASSVLERLDKFEIDLTPIHNLVELWQENDYGMVSLTATSDDEDLYLSSGTSLDDGIMTVPSAGGGDNAGFIEVSAPGEDASWIEKTVYAVGNILQNGWDKLVEILSSVGNLSSIFTSFGTLYNSISGAISGKVNLIFDTVKYLFTNGLSLLMLPIHLLSQTFSFTFWLLGFDT